jgi:hypothetical protein
MVRNVCRWFAVFENRIALPPAADVAPPQQEKTHRAANGSSANIAFATGACAAPTPCMKRPGSAKTACAFIKR